MIHLTVISSGNAKYTVFEDSHSCKSGPFLSSLFVYIKCFKIASFSSLATLPSFERTDAWVWHLKLNHVHCSRFYYDQVGTLLLPYAGYLWEAYFLFLGWLVQRYFCICHEIHIYSDQMVKVCVIHFCSLRVFLVVIQIFADQMKVEAVS